MNQSGQRSIVINIVADTICPWCYLGTTRLRRSAELRPGVALDLRHRPFLLTPQMPNGGMARDNYLIWKFGSLARAMLLQKTIEEMANSLDMPLSFDKIQRTPASLSSHRLLWFSARQGRSVAVLDALYRAYFVEGRDIGDHDTLLSLAQTADLDRSEVDAFLRSDAGTDQVLKDNSWARRQGVTGVPTFIFDSGNAISGVQEPQVFARLIDVACQLPATDAPLASFVGDDPKMSPTTLR